MRNKYTLTNVQIWLTASILLALAYHHWQPANAYQLNPLSDANEYEKIYHFFHGHESTYPVRYGIHTRIMVPLLASSIPYASPQQSFFLVNTIFGLLAVFLLLKLLAYFDVSNIQKNIAVLYFILHWVGPFRANAMTPLNVDVAVFCFEILFLLLFLQKKALWLMLLTPLAVATKEVMLALLFPLVISAVVSRSIFKQKSLSIPWILGIFGLGLATKIALNLYFPSTAPERNSILVMAFHLKQAMIRPDHILRWIISLFAAYGSLLALVFFKPYPIRLPSYSLAVLFLCSISALALSFLGGMDYTRLIFLGYPFVIVTIFKVARPSRQQCYLAGGISILMCRAWQLLPDPSIDLSRWGAWMPESANPHDLILWIFSAFLVILILWVGNYFISPANDPTAE